MHSVALRELYHMVCLDQELLTEPNQPFLQLPYSVDTIIVLYTSYFFPALSRGVVLLSYRAGFVTDGG